jgi:UDP-galactopyranose mutase
VNDRQVRTEQFNPLTQPDDDQPFDLVCLSHLRWDSIFQRPHHLLSRCARARRVFYIEEPIVADGPARLELSQQLERLTVITPYVPASRVNEYVAIVQSLLETFFSEQAITRYALWYYTPMSLGFSRHLRPLATVYDCMDELSAFSGASPALRERERELFARADLVFTGGQSLYEAKRGQHPRVYAFPSSVDVAHFAQARGAGVVEPDDQRAIAHPRLGFFGAIDERMDLALLDRLAQARPEWQLVVIGPVVKIDPQTLPQRPNIHYLGRKSYAELPQYLAGWDVALMPFARNEATRFISPTKTPEYLAAGRPVVATPIRDVVRPYGVQGLVRIAADAAEFEAAIAAALAEDPQTRQPQADAFLEQMSWDGTWAEMDRLVRGVVAARGDLPAERMDLQQRVVER